MARFSVPLAILVALVTMVAWPAEVESKMRRVRQQKPAAAPAPAPAAPGPDAAAAAQPAAPGASPNATGVNPGSQPMAPPGAPGASPNATGVNPGSQPIPPVPPTNNTQVFISPPSATPSPSGPGAAAPVAAPNLLLKEIIPVDEKEGCMYLTQYLSSVYYLCSGKFNKKSALQKCQSMTDDKKLFDLAGLGNPHEFEKVIAALSATGTTSVIVNAMFDTRDGKKVRIHDGLYGRQIQEMSARRKRQTELVSYAERRLKRAKPPPAKAGAVQPQINAVPAPASASPRLSLGAFVTVKETQFPWLGTWPSQQPCVDNAHCAPTVCEVTTPECLASTNDCTVTSTASCSVAPGANCTLVCENCKIEKPVCFVKEPKCVVVKERKCKITPPICEITNANCTVKRPECVTRQPPCNITKNDNVTCITPEFCMTEQGLNCKEVDICTDAERAIDPSGCKYKECKPTAICIKPEYCRLEKLMCPPVETFCPAEIVSCEPPQITCGEPNIACDEPKIYCPPPTVVCTKPLVNCSAPTVSCPNVITSCPNPGISCPPPTVTCPAPLVTCTPPANPCPIVPPSHKPCVPECTGNCKCVLLEKDKFSELDCAAENSIICEGGLIGTKNLLSAPKSGKPSAPAAPAPPAAPAKPGAKTG